MKITAFACASILFAGGCSHQGTEVQSTVKSTRYIPVVKCDGLTFDVGLNNALKQLVINNVDQAFNNLGNYGSLGKSGSMIAKWDQSELVLREYRVKWDSQFASYSGGVLVTANKEGDKMHVKVFAATLLNEDNGIVNPSNLVFKIDHVFNNCHSL